MPWKWNPPPPLTCFLTFISRRVKITRFVKSLLPRLSLGGIPRISARLLVARVAAVLFNGESNENELSTDWLSKGPHRDGIERNPMAKIEIDFSATTLDSVAQFSIGINIRASGLTRMI